ncbi:MAG: LbtU family siderophore porin [Deltaproteobacteria bacterium]|nr:LbtU family siderophore porin [Candidatus Tharpella aukensis]
MRQYIILPLLIISLLFFALPAFADDMQSMRQQIDLLKQQLNDLQKQLSGQRQDIQSNVQHISGHKRDLERNRTHLQKQEKQLEENRDDQEKLAHLSEGLKLLNDHVTISGLVEVEAGYSKDFDDNDASDITLATVELGIEIDLHKYVKASILFLWEEDDTEPVDLDEGYIYLGNTEHFPLYLQVGKLYVSFGNFESNMISDPLTLELGETRESSAVLGLEFEGLYAGAYAFNGDIDKRGDDDEIKCYGFNTGYAFENDTLGLDIGMDWINSIADSDTLGDALPGKIKSYVSGFTAHANFSWQGFNLIGEYLGATDDFKADELEFKGKGAQPEAWNIEVGYIFEIAGHETVIAMAYQGSDEALALELPEERFLGTVGIGLIDGLSLALEYAHDEDYDKKDGGTGDNADTVTLQMALEF